MAPIKDDSAEKGRSRKCFCPSHCFAAFPSLRHLIMFVVVCRMKTCPSPQKRVLLNFSEKHNMHRYESLFRQTLWPPFVVPSGRKRWSWLVAQKIGARDPSSTINQIWLIALPFRSGIKVVPNRQIRVIFKRR